MQRKLATLESPGVLGVLEFAAMSSYRTKIFRHAEAEIKTKQILHTCLEQYVHETYILSSIGERKQTF